MKVIDIAIKDLKPYANNAKGHPKKQIELLAKNIQRFGFTTPILIDAKNEVIAGHGRLLALQHLKATKAPVVRLEGLSASEVKALRLADNRIAEMGEWDLNLAIGDLKELDLELMELTGFDKDLLLETNDKDDAVPDEAPAISKLGDLYQLGEHRVLCGDATKEGDLARLMGEQKADMIFTDPPYNVDYTGKTKDALKIQNDKKDDAGFYEFLLASFTNLASYTKKGAGAYICHADSEGLNFRRAFIEAGFQMKQCLIWNKNVMVMGRQDYHWKHEPILYGWQEGEAHAFYGGRTQVTVWDVARPSRSETHPTMKPVALIEKALTNSSKRDDIILDTFLGSGSTLIAAEKTGRICYGIELDPVYIDVCLARYESYTGLKAKKVV